MLRFSNVLLKLFITAFIGIVLSTFSGIPPVYTIAGLLLLSFTMPKTKGVLNEFIIGDLQEEFGEYYENIGQNMKSLLTLIKQKTITPSYATSIITENDQYKASRATIGSVLQGFQKGFTPRGNPNFSPRKFDLFNMKIDLDLYPDDIKESYLGFLSDIKQEDRSKWPVVRYVIEKLVMPQLKSDLETKAYYKGVYNAPTAGTPSSASESMDGIRKLLLDGNPNLLGLGSLDADDIFDKVEDSVLKVGDEMDGVPMLMFMSPKKKLLYFRDKRNTHGTDNNYDKNKALTIDGRPEWEIVGLPGMADTDDLIITPRSNFLNLRKMKGYNQPKVETLKREVFLMLDFWEGFAFGLDELVWFNNGGVSSGSGS